MTLLRPPFYILVSIFLVINAINLSAQTSSKSSVSPRDSLYNEMYRPQFHFSPKKGWIGDPDGTIKYNGEYHLFWWGHATSKDLVYWNEEPYPMKGGDGTFTYYTGTIVVDTLNTAGFGTEDSVAMIAIYTMHHRKNSKTPDIEEQAISISKDYRNFHFWEGNPVIESEREHFRDPYVFWDEIYLRWAMVITAPIEKQIEIYTSNDLKNWEYKSSFGPLGAVKEMWEVPELFQIPLNDDSNNKKWVMICGMGPNKAQFWVGDFDGERFTPDSITVNYLTKGDGLSGILIEDFELGYSFWNESESNRNESFHTIDQSLQGYFGDSYMLVRTGQKTSSMNVISKEFTIEKNNINFLFGSSSKVPTSGVKLFVGNREVAHKQADGIQVFSWVGFDVSEWVGEKAHIEVSNTSKDSIDWVAVDHFIQSDVLLDTGREHANWIDWGQDFYAISRYRNYDEKEDEKYIWIGWLGNWTYIRDNPTPWGSTAESIPRSISLISSSEGYTITQNPINEFKKLRSDSVSIDSRDISGTIPLKEFMPVRNTYELKATFELNGLKEQDFGLNIAVGGTDKIVLGYDRSTSNIYLDRTKSGEVSFHPEFPSIAKAPISIDDGEITFHVFVDQLSVEVFINDGKKSISSLVFPKPESVGIEFFSNNGTTHLRRLDAWNLSSIWE